MMPRGDVALKYRIALLGGCVRSQIVRGNAILRSRGIESYKSPFIRSAANHVRIRTLNGESAHSVALFAERRQDRIGGIVFWVRGSSYSPWNLHKHHAHRTESASRWIDMPRAR